MVQQFCFDSHQNSSTRDTLKEIEKKQIPEQQSESETQQSAKHETNITDIQLPKCKRIEKVPALEKTNSIKVTIL